MTKPPPRPSKTVLLVDDDIDIRETVSQVLEGEGYSVRQAANGFEALKQLEDMGSEPCLVLLDMMMPEMNGGELLAVLDEAHRLATLPVVVCSAHAEQAHGARRVLRKPVSLGLLLRVVEQFCNGLYKRNVANGISP